MSLSTYGLVKECLLKIIDSSFPFVSSGGENLNRNEKEKIRNDIIKSNPNWVKIDKNYKKNPPTPLILIVRHVSKIFIKEFTDTKLVLYWTSNRIDLDKRKVLEVTGELELIEEKSSWNELLKAISPLFIFVLANNILVEPLGDIKTSIRFQKVVNKFRTQGLPVKLGGKYLYVKAGHNITDYVNSIIEKEIDNQLNYPEETNQVDRKVLLLGSYEKDGLDRLREIRKEFLNLGYKTTLLKEESDRDAETLIAKLVRITTHCKFVFVDDCVVSGHIRELAILKEIDKIVIVGIEDKLSTYMIQQDIESCRHFKIAKGKKIATRVKKAVELSKKIEGKIKKSIEKGYPWLKK